MTATRAYVTTPAGTYTKEEWTALVADYEALEALPERKEHMVIAGAAVIARVRGEGDGRLIFGMEVRNARGVGFAIINRGSVDGSNWWTGFPGVAESDTMQGAVESVVAAAKRGRLWTADSWERVYRLTDRYKARIEREAAGLGEAPCATCGRQD
ncbi:hypothetical protein OG871_40630 (plasmid) [Kitasatospora sp. NBC_00374]|uniref:hypothetical protein n=1 Tax=Kitasatospora sp. NBC_00374 TaxID=2975964 RepID=UPI002F9090E7